MKSFYTFFIITFLCLGFGKATAQTVPAPLASLIAVPNATGDGITKSGFATLGVLWLITAAIAYHHIRHGRVADHERWMIFNYALTFAAVTLRLWMPVLIGGFGLVFLDAYRIVAWLCWVPNLLVAGRLVVSR